MKEKNSALRKTLAIICMIALVANIILRLGFKAYSDVMFWIIILVVALIAWPVMNYLKK